MERNFTKTRLAARRTPNSASRWRLVLVIGVIVFLICAGGFLIHLFKSSSIEFFHNNVFSRLTNWLEERKSHLQYGLVKAKSLPTAAVNQNNADSQIHFEFYNTLPNMQVNLADAKPIEPIAKHDDVKVKPIERLTPQPALAKTRIASAFSTDTKTKSKIKAKPYASQFVVSAEELEREFSNQIKQKKCILQLGMFRDSAAAKRYRKVLSRAGLKVTIVKIKEGKQEAYRIQQGPFLNVNRARSAQKTLQKRGIASLVIKMNQA